ncbi:MAG: hypothetical protein SVY53_10540 [Chloroflexota bacterium]|nr:hypothetical protein [Chloroflexota bacterium]
MSKKKGHPEDIITIDFLAANLSQSFLRKDSRCYLVPHTAQN